VCLINSVQFSSVHAADEMNGLTRKLMCYGSNTTFWIYFQVILYKIDRLLSKGQEQVTRNVAIFKVLNSDEQFNCLPHACHLADNMANNVCNCRNKTLSRHDSWRSSAECRRPYRRLIGYTSHEVSVPDSHDVASVLQMLASGG